MNKPNAVAKKTIRGPVNWVDVNFIISIVTMNYEKEKIIYWLDCIDANSLDKFVTNKFFINCNLFSFQFHSMFSFFL
jgi:hypothetical protein